MDKFSTFTGIAVPLKRTDVDTDQIVPARYMKRITKTGYDDALFHTWRQDPDFILNQPRYANAEILIAGLNFGTGSSREHAVWALKDYGFRAVISPRFADIFRANAGKQGLLAAQVGNADLTRIWGHLDAAPELPVTIDLDSRKLELNGESFEFQIDDHTRWRLLQGLDEIDTTLQHAAAIEAFELRRAAWLPKTLPQRSDEGRL